MQPTNANNEWSRGSRKFPLIKQRDFEDAVGYFQSSLSIDPDFARASGWLAYTYVTGVIDGWDFSKLSNSPTKQDAITEAVKLADKAVAVDVGDYDNHWAKGFVLLHSGNPTGSKSSFDTALTKYRMKKKKNPHLFIEAADERIYAGDHAGAYVLLLEGEGHVPPGQLKKDWHLWVRAWVQYFRAQTDSGLYADALADLQNLRHEPGDPNGKAPGEIYLLRAALYRKTGKISDANADVQAYQKLHNVKVTSTSLADTNPFQKDDDLKHWVSGVLPYPKQCVAFTIVVKSL